MAPLNFFGLAILLLLVGHECDGKKLESLSTICVRKLEKTEKEFTGETLSGIVGNGWDVLLDHFTKPIFNDRYTYCKTDPLKRFLVPQDVTATPIYETEFTQKAVKFETYEDFKKKDITTFNAAVGIPIQGVTLRASFGTENQNIKDEFIRNKFSMDFPLGFEDRVNAIIDAVKTGTGNPQCLAEDLIADYGTHYVVAADAGAYIEVKTYVDSKSVTNNETEVEKVNESVGLALSGIGAEINHGHETDNIHAVQTSSTIKNQVIDSDGSSIADLLNAKKTGRTDGIKHFAAFNRQGEWLYKVISPRNFPTADLHSLSRAKNFVENASKEYIRKNTYRGCMDPRAKNFNYTANANEGCIYSEKFYDFGGVYQTCQVADSNTPDEDCARFRQPMNVNRAYHCQTDYEPQLLFKETYLTGHHTRQVEECAPAVKTLSTVVNWFSHAIGQKTVCNHHDYTYNHNVIVEAYWCRRRNNQLVELPKAFFGGWFTSGTPNPITHGKSCPETFREHSLGKDFTICISRDPEVGFAKSIPFSKFYGCDSSDQTCEQGYTPKSMAITENHCRISYCEKSQHPMTYNPPELQKLPFSKCDGV